MPRNVLNAQKVKSAKPGQKLGDGGGLRLIVGKDGRRWWEYRYRFGGKDFTLGCGGNDTSLAVARAQRDLYEAQIKEGTNPKAVKQAQKAESSGAGTVREMAELFLASRGQEFSDKHRAKWLRPVEQHASAVLDAQWRDVTKADVLNVLEPIWGTKTDTAKRVRQRLNKVFEYAFVRHEHHGLNPAAWEGNLALLLPSPGKISSTVHYKADPYEAMPSVWVNLRKYQGSGPDCVRWVILTLVRSNEARGARWDEINWDAKQWEIPAHRMKGGKRAHTVPLTSEAINLLKRRQKEATGDLIFPNQRGAALTDVAVTKAFRRAGAEGTVHGIRSSFRVWAAERTKYGDDVAERQLAHEDSNKVQAAYKRTEMLDFRRKQLNEWVKFLNARQFAVVEGRAD